MSNENNDKNTGNVPTLTFDITKSMEKVGIHQFFLEGQDFILKFNDGGMRCIPFNSKCNSISESINKFHQKLKGEPDYESWNEVLQDIESILIDQRDEIFSLKEYSIKNEYEDQPKSHYFEQVSNLRDSRNLSYKEWQLLVAQKYENLQRVVKKNFPEAWSLLEFCLAVKSILNIDGCTIPFMGVILAKPSSMKTLVIQLFRKYPQSLYTDNFTPASFVSHNAAKNEEQLRKLDLLPKLSNRLFLTPELAPLFTANEDELRKSLGTITRILDGHGLETDSGAQGHRGYGKTFFVWLGAAVEIPFRVMQLLGTLGHKIYFFRPILPEKTVQELEKIAKEDDFQDRFQGAEESLLEYLIEIDAAPDSTNSRKDENGIVKIKWNKNECPEQDLAIKSIAQIANLQKRLRGTVYVSRAKKKYSTNAKSDAKNDYENQESNTITADESDYDTDYPIVEDPSRAVIMLRILALGNAISQGRDYITMEDISLIVSVALSTTTKARSELARLLLKKGGEITTSTIVKENKISSPFAKKTMRELEALGLANVSSVARYDNSEFKIKLKDEYNWFMEEDFQKLLRNDQDSKKSGSESDGIYNQNETIVITDTNNQKASAFDSEYSHMLKPNSPPQTHTTSTELSQSKLDNDIQSEVTPTLKNSCERELRAEEKNNMSLVESFQRVTSEARAMNDNLSAEETGTNDEVMNFIITSLIGVIKTGNGSIFSLDSILRSIYDQNENVRRYLGDQITQRENRKVRRIYLAILHYGNQIHVVKTKPQVTVKWVGCVQII